ncbi:MAG: pilus assembly protein PilP [Polyangia bacterium]
MARRFPAVVVALAFLLVGACGGDDDSSYRRPKRDKVRPGMSSIDARKRIEEQGAGLVEKKKGAHKEGDLSLPKLTETDFIESSRNRDPFRPSLEVVEHEKKAEHTTQREIKLEDYDIAELKLIGIVTNIGDPRAMVVTPDNNGIVLRRGDYVGRADFVDQGPGTEQVQVNWKVVRIHGSGKEEERGIYLARDDPWTPTPDDVTRFMPLHPRE